MKKILRTLSGALNYVLQRTVDAVNREMMVLQQSRVEMEKHVEKLVMEREELKRKLDDSKTMKSEEARVRNASLT